nr:glucose dehydrogenase [FAD, quinone]-like [Leptinotarsa decemlineata]
MNLHFYCIIVIHLFRLYKCSDFDQFVDYVSDNLKYSEGYIPRKNNKDSVETCDSSVHYYGEYDFIIVGGGSAGSVLANRLSEINDWKVLLLEAGGNQTDFSDIPAFNGYVLHSHMDWGYYAKPSKTFCQGMVNKQCSFPRGKVLGGSAVSNVMVYHRASPLDYDFWASSGNDGWSYKEVLPYFIKSERIQIDEYDHGYHGTNGPLRVNYTAPHSTVSEPFFRACEEKGLKRIDYNGKDTLGVSRVQFNINFNKRDNSAHAFLDPIIDNRSNLRVLLNAFAIKILLKGSTAEGVEFVKDCKRYIVKARKEVILSSGSINSPQLLMISGIGPKEELNKHKIEVKNELPVGRHMKDHTMFFNLVFRSNEVAPNKTLRENLERYIKGETPLTNALGVENVAFINTKMPGKGLPDIELITSPPPLGVANKLQSILFFNFDSDVSKVFDAYNPLTDFSIYVVLLNPKSIGSVTLQSKNPIDFPVIDLNYFSDPNNEDIETMYQGVKYVLSLSKTRAFRDINATFIGHQLGCEDLKKNGSEREYWYCALRQFSTTIFHPMSTTRMGRSPKESVVDSKCLVHRTKNLRVVDAGVIPNIIRGHPNAPIYMIAEKISDEIKKYYGKL